MKSLQKSPADLAAMAQVANEYDVIIEHECSGTITRVQPASAYNGFQLSRGGTNVTLDPFEPIWPPLNYREAFTLRTLTEIGVDQIAYSSLIRWCDPETVKKLAARGYIIARPPGRKISDDEIRLTDEGLLAWTAALKHRSVGRSENQV
ncbi:hypothetical protein [Rhizobium leguminosarum]|uniref:hypothetical protein n=1 Tax=Rhizobium leguminosarum TaxID=384 RepID=UPI0014427E75|nr:hypothetical protein [Rhizobium leguminosarum]MBY3026638.1 hypothetical protein [Rhizobium leguminosarum]NKL74078.1 hypothetical protein [Rhizobium leguminosarum bv. viciae]